MATSPRSELTITADEVTSGGPGRAVGRIARSAAPLELRRNAVRQTGWWLTPAGDSGAAAISLIGFDPGEVRKACVDHGWEFRD